MQPSSSRLEILIGRTLAVCAHPMVAWRARASFRLIVLAGYATAGYIATFALLVLLT
jgi:hypothetical protein